MIISQPQLTQTGVNVRSYQTEHLTNIEFIEVMQAQFVFLGEENTVYNSLKSESKDELLQIVKVVKTISLGNVNSAFSELYRLLAETKSRIANTFANTLTPVVEKLTIYIPVINDIPASTDILANPKLKAEIVEALDSHGKEV